MLAAKQRLVQRTNRNFRLREAMTVMRCISLLLILFLLSARSRECVCTATKYGVTVETSNAPALLKASTYAFVPGQPVYDKALDALIIAAIDRELNARGVTKVDVGTL